MPRDFNELLAEDRTFIVRDETFSFVDASPEILTSFDASMNGDDDENAVWKLMDAQIMLFLRESDRERWQKLRARKEEPVTIAQLTEIVRWLMEQQTGRPTNPPAPSEAGRGRTEASSGGA